MGILGGFERNGLCDFEKTTQACLSEKKEESNKKRRKASRNKFVEKSGVPERFESFGVGNEKEENCFSL